MYRVILCVICLLSPVMSEDLKSSLSFVIDNTGSMTHDIDAVIKRSTFIFDTINVSNETHVQGFMLVTFNDPDASFRIYTKNHQLFKSHVTSIDIRGGDDCPEYSMTGIEMALEQSRVGSYVYIFTDATAKDHHLFGRVKTLAQKKQSQIMFVMLGACNFDKDALVRTPDYQVYYDLTSATQGLVFHVAKQDLGTILDGVMELIEKGKTVIASPSFPPSYNNNFSFEVDSHIEDVTLTVTGKEPQLAITGPDGKVPNIKQLMTTTHVSIVKILDPKPGLYTAVIGSKTETNALVTADTDITFRHGFSAFEPSSILDTASAPRPGEKSYLSIKLNGKGVKLHTVNFLDINGNILQNYSLAMADAKEKLYLSLGPLEPPTGMFYVEVLGTDSAGKPIRRISTTSVEVQNEAVEKPKQTAPIVTIDDAPKVKLDYNKPAQLKCRVTAYPKPIIAWEDVRKGEMLLPTQFEVMDLDVTEYLSILNIDAVNKSNTYKCIADNNNGQDDKLLTVEPNLYFNILERPKDTTIEYTKEGKLTCRVNARPHRKIVWYRNGRRIYSDKRWSISNDGSILTIKSMHPSLVGQYICYAWNKFNRKILKSQVKISGAAPPQIEKLMNDTLLMQGSSKTISCKILGGIPKPTLVWYMKRPDEHRFRKLHESSEYLNLYNVGSAASGIYRCKATNEWGADAHNIDVLVQYPPVILRTEDRILAKLGETVALRCDASGDPIPTITWKKDGKAITDSSLLHLQSDNSISLHVTLDSEGTYTCDATNTLSSASKTIVVTGYEPVSIPPPQSIYSYMVGSSVVLPCEAEGYPTPNVKWTFFSPDRSVLPRTITPRFGTSIIISKLQISDQGFYTCDASNLASSLNITYNLTVNAKPIIEKRPSEIYKAVQGDIALRIPCNASGSPKPTVSWSLDGNNLVTNSEWFDVDSDNSLIIKNVGNDSIGVYTCTATNDYGTDTNNYEVLVEKSPARQLPTSTITIQEGKSATVKCEAPHQITDEVRWYKDGIVIAYYTKLYLDNVTRDDAGIYICRVGSVLGSRNGYTEVKIGYPPEFTSDEKTDIDLQVGKYQYLRCDAVSEPAPTVTWWYNGNKMTSTTDMTYSFEMQSTDAGQYLCEVSNKFGKIDRVFEITSEGCSLNITEVTENQPLLLSLEHDTRNGILHIPKNENITLACRGKFAHFVRSKIVAICESEDKFRIGRRSFKYSELKCEHEIKPAIENVGTCNGNNKKLSVSYDLSGTKLDLFDVCIDEHLKTPIYVKNNMYHTLAGVETTKGNLVDTGSFYDGDLQIETMSSTLGRWFHTNDECHFAKRQLIDSRDVPPGLPQQATLNSIISVPHWSSCNTKNWDDLESRVRSLVKSVSHKLMVWTGTAQQLQMRSLRGDTRDIYLRDDDGNQQAVPLYLWKVIQDPASASSLAVIQLNIPDLTLPVAYKHLRCKDVCDSVEWMDGTFWRDLTNGYTYCCEIKDFEDAFGYRGVFNNYPNVLRNITSISKHIS